MQMKRQIKTMEELSEAIGVSTTDLVALFSGSRSRSASTSIGRSSADLRRSTMFRTFFATRLNRKSTRLIGVIIPRLNDLFFTSLLERDRETAAVEGRVHQRSLPQQFSHGDDRRWRSSAVENLRPVHECRWRSSSLPLGPESSSSVEARQQADQPDRIVDSRPALAEPNSRRFRRHRQSAKH